MPSRRSGRRPPRRPRLDIAGHGRGAGQRPKTVAMASVHRIRFRRGTALSPWIRPACLVTATSVPRLSNRSTKKKTKTISSSPGGARRGDRDGTR